MVNRGGGGCMGVCDNVLDEYNTGPTELVVVVNMLHMFSYGQQGGGGWGVRGNNRVYVIVPFLAFIQWKIVSFI